MYLPSTLQPNVFWKVLQILSPHVAQDVAQFADISPLVNVTNGSYYGIHNPTFGQDLFLGIPFAQPPLGDLRFRQAQSLNTSWADVRNATEYSPMCIGYGTDDVVLGNPVSEDCLTLNVIRPTGSSSNLPVAVWIHGGGFVEGGGRDPRYNLSFIVQQSVESQNPFMAVSINYRLQAWGWLFGTEILKQGQANIGLKDQRLALHWIQENIAAFGGDPRKVTIWGESSGAGSVGAHLVAYGGRDDGLFRAAIAESGAPTVFGRYSPTFYFDTFYNNITLAVNCSNASDTLACLRTVPVESLSSVFNSSVIALANWEPRIDGDFLNNSASVQLTAGDFVSVPLLIGANHDEGTSFGIRGINTTEEFLASVFSILGPNNATTAEIADLYPDIPDMGIPGTLDGRPPPENASLGIQYKRAAAYGGDIFIHAPRRFANQAWAAQNVSSWSYVFNVLVNGLDGLLGASHFQEVAFVMGNVDGIGYDIDPFGGEPNSYVQLATKMTRMWGSFIVNLDPNYDSDTGPMWPEYKMSNPQNIVFDTNVTDLAYVDPDTYRADGIAFISKHLVDVYGR